MAGYARDDAQGVDGLVGKLGNGAVRQVVEPDADRGLDLGNWDAGAGGRAWAQPALEQGEADVLLPARAARDQVRTHVRRHGQHNRETSDRQSTAAPVDAARNRCVAVFDHVGLLFDGPPGSHRVALHLVIRLKNSPEPIWNDSACTPTLWVPKCLIGVSRTKTSSRNCRVRL